MADTSLKIIIEAAVGQAKQALSSVSSQMDTLSDNVQRTNKELKSQAVDVSQVQAGLTKVAVAATAVAVASGGLTLAFAKQATELEQNQIAFGTMLGSAEAAKIMIEDLQDLAKTTPFGMTEVIKGAKMLTAYGTAAGDVRKELTMLGDVSAGLAIPLNDLVYLYGTLQVQGRAYAKDLTQFAGRGIPIYEELAKVMGVTKDQIKGMVEEGKIGFPEVQQAFKNMTSEGGKFHNLMLAQSASLGGMWANFTDSLEIMAAEIGTAMMPALKAVLGVVLSITEAISEFVEANPAISQAIGVILIATTAVAALVAGYALLAKTIISVSIPSFTAMTASLNLVNTSMTALFAKITPFILPAIAIIGALYLAWKTNLFYIQDILKGFVSTLKSIFQSVVTIINIGVDIFLYFADQVDSALTQTTETTDTEVNNLVGIFSGFNERMAGLGAAFKLIFARDFEAAALSVPDSVQTGMFLMLDIVATAVDKLAIPLNLGIGMWNKFKKAFDETAKETEKIDMSNWANEMSKAFINVRAEAVKTGKIVTENLDKSFGSSGSSTAKSKDNFAKFAEDIKKQAESISRKIGSIRQSMADLRKETEEANKSNRMNLAEAYVDAEQKIKELKEERRDIEKELRNEESEERRRSLQKELQEVENNLQQEAQALESVSSYKGEISRELSEARKLAAMSELERAAYYYDQEKKKIQEVHDDKLAKLKEELKAVEDQRNEMVRQIAEKNNELKKLYGEDTGYFRKELTEQVGLLEQTGKEMVDMYNQIAAARANALGGSAKTVKFQTTATKGKRATGGFVEAGSTYMVGERGAEMFTPQRSGYIIPNNKMSGGVTVVVNVGGNVATERDLAESMMDIFTRELKLSNQIT